ncbi:MAG: amidohydrolase family protein [Sheuella sp.]|nr:amidohydrolase family protein [Sheuella sp.]
MTIIDAQVHAYERNHPTRPWANVLHGPAEVTGKDMIAAMDAAGVDAAILVSVFTMYEFDASYAMDVYAAYPHRFRLIKPVNPSDLSVEETIAEWSTTPGAIAIRIMLNRGISDDPADAGINRVLAAAARYNLPVNLLCWGRLEQVRQLALRNPHTQIVVDHLGLQQPYEPPPLDNPFGDLPAVIALADCPNVAIKITGACTLSKQEYPYQDIWTPVRKILDAYGLTRCMWGTDWTRAIKILSYQQGVDAFRTTDQLSSQELSLLMGENLQNIYKWNFKL